MSYITILLQDHEWKCYRHTTCTWMKTAFLNNLNYIITGTPATSGYFCSSKGQCSDSGKMHETEAGLEEMKSSDATVILVEDITPTVRWIQLKLHNPNFTFRAGQWVDLKIPTISRVGGYSMWRAPHALKETGHLDLAVKQSDHPPTEWVHTKCQPGCEARVTIGGKFYIDSYLTQEGLGAVLVAGGVGINPLMSMLLHIVHMTDIKHHLAPKHTTLLYSASCVEELQFKEILDEVARKHKDVLTVQLFVTRGSTGDIPMHNITISERRINSDDVNSAIKGLPECSDVHGFICGPAPMLDTMEAYMQDAGLSDSNIHYEKWW